MPRSCSTSTAARSTNSGCRAGTGGSHSLLGTGSEWNPDVVVIKSMYLDHYAGWSTHRPAEVARIHARLETEYRWDYSEGEYEVYPRIRP